MNYTNTLILYNQLRKETNQTGVDSEKGSKHVG